MEVTHLCLTLCDPIDYTVHGIFQARILEWVAVPFSRGSSQPGGSNWGFLHCRQILYHLNYQGSPWYKCVCEFLNVYRGAWGGFLVSSTLDLMKTVRFIGHKVCYLHSLQL